MIEGARRPARPARHGAGARRVQGPRLPLRQPGRHHDLQERRGDPARQGGDPRALRGRGRRDPRPVRHGPDLPGGAPRGRGREVERGHRRGRRRRCRSNLARAEPHLHDGQLRRPWLVQADPPAGRHARPDGQPEGRDHRAPDQGQLHGGPDGARVLHLDPRRPQGPGRHGAAHRRLGLPHPPPGRRRAGRDRARGGLRHQGVHRDAAARARTASPTTNLLGRFTATEVKTKRGRRCSPEGRADHPGDLARARRGARGEDDATVPRALGAQVRGRHRHLPALLRRGPGHRQAGGDRRRGRHHRRPVDRRAGHAAHAADLPHRRRRRAWTSPRASRAWSSCSRRASRRAWPSWPRSTARSSIERTEKALKVTVTDDAGEEHAYSFPRAHAPVRRGGREDRGRRPAQRGLDLPARAAGDPRPHRHRGLPRRRRSRRSTAHRAWTSRTSTSRSSSGR